MWVLGTRGERRKRPVPKLPSLSGRRVRASLDREDTTRLRTLAGDGRMIAVTDGYHPALAYI